MTNVLREIKNRANAQNRMQSQFAEAREEALERVEAEISVLYAEGQETVNFRFDAFSMWGFNAANARDAFWKDFPVDLPTDDWRRAVWSLTKEQALAIAKHVELWNATWEYQIARHFDVNQNDYYNALSVVFCPATGTEHTVKAGARGMDDAWQWN